MPEFRRFPSGQDALSQATLNDNTLVPCRYQEGTANDSDKSIPFSILNSTPVAVCNSSADSVQKVATVDNFPDFTLTNGREVSVYFANGNTATSPSFNLNNTGAMALGLENQASSVSIGSGCWGGGVWLTLKYVDITVAGNRIQKWIIKGHDVASISNGVTTKADGTTVYNTQTVDNIGNYPLNSEITDYNNAFVVGKTTRYSLGGGIANAPDNLGAYMLESVSSPQSLSSNYYGYQIATRVGNGVAQAKFIRVKNGANNWTDWEKVATETNINGIIYNEYIDDLDLNFLSGSNFLQKHFPNLFTGGVFFSLDMTAIEKDTGKYVRVIYNCKRDSTASYKIKDNNGLNVSAFNQYGTVVISGNTNKLIQKTKVLAIVQNGTYIPLT